MQILIDNSAGDASLQCTSMYMSAQPCFSYCHKKKLNRYFSI